MKTLALVSMVVLVLLLPASGCHGPQKLSRGLDEWANTGYMDSPWIYGNLLSHIFLGVGNGVTWMIDSFINTYYFWVDDAPPFGSGKGTGYPFKPVMPTKK